MIHDGQPKQGKFVSQSASRSLIEVASLNDGHMPLHVRRTIPVLPRYRTPPVLGQIPQVCLL